MVKDRSTTSLKMFLFSYYATNSILIGFLPIYLRSKGLTGTEIGWVLAIGPFATIIAQPFFGYMSDKYKTIKRMILICICGLLLSGFIFFQAEQLVYILLTGMVFYFFTTPVVALGDSLGQRRANELGIAFGSIRTWGSIGFATSSLLIGAFLTNVGIGYMMWPYLILGTISLFFATRLTDVKANEESVEMSDIKKLVQNKPFFIFLLFIMFITIAHRTNDSFIGLHIQNLGGTEQLVGLAWFVGLVSEAIVFALAVYWFKKYPSIVFVIIAGFIYIVRWVLFAQATEPYEIIILQITHGITFAVLYVASFDYISKLTPKLLESTGHLLFYSVFFGVSGIIGSLAGGTILDTYGGGFLYMCLAISTAIGTGCLLVYYIVSRNKTSSS